MEENGSAYRIIYMKEKGDIRAKMQRGSKEIELSSCIINKSNKIFQLFGASVIIYKNGKILLQKRKDNNCWGYHGGRVELGEIVKEAAKRELFEETGLTANSLKLFGVFSGPELHHIYPDGNEVHIIDTVYLCDDFSGTTIFQEEECLDLQWFAFDSIPEKLSPPIIPALKKFIELHHSK